MKFDRNLTFKVGIILVVISTILIAILPGLIYFYGIPFFVFILGLILVWVGKRKIITKILYTITPILFFFTYQYFWKEYKTIEPETFLIPKNYRGCVRIMFNSKCGEEIQYENKRRLYKIPKDGILLTKFNDEQGYINFEFYLVDENGKRKKIQELDVRDFNEEWTTEKNPKEPSRDKLAIFHARRTYSDGSS